MPNERSREAEGGEEGESPVPLRKEDYEALAHFRNALRRFLHFTEEGARAAGLTPQQHQAMLAVKGRPDREWVTIGELAEALQIRHHTAVELVDRCVVSDLFARETSPEDRRQVRIHITPHGEEILERLSRRNMRELIHLRGALNAAALGEPGA